MRAIALLPSCWCPRRPTFLTLLLMVLALGFPSHIVAERVVTLYETEVLQDVWRGASPSRWTSENGVESLPPNQMSPPSAALRWLGDWKIVTGESRDSLGWEYLTNKDGLPLRRRVWLRTVGPTLPPPELRDAPRQTDTKGRQKDRPKARPNLAMRRIRENWNFKGFGLTFYKSFLFWDSFGVALTTPITYNVDWWERHPSLPSITTSAILYHPFMVIFFISASIQTATITYFLEQGLKTLRYFVMLTILVLLRASIFPFVAFRSIIQNLNRIDKQIFRVPFLEDWMDKLRLSAEVAPWPYAPPTYNLDWQERVGLSWSWRWSVERGYETRLTKWYLFLPTVLSLWDAMVRPVAVRLFGEASAGSKPAVIDWLRQKTTSLGISTGVPTPEPPHFSCSGLLSLSGLYFRRRVGFGPSVPSLRSEDADLSDDLSELSDDGVEFPNDSNTASVEKTPQQLQARTVTSIGSKNKVLSG